MSCAEMPALSEQPAAVRDAILGKDVLPEELLEDFDVWCERADLTGGEFYKLLCRFASEYPLPGQTDTAGTPEMDADYFLNSIGISGIEYTGSHENCLAAKCHPRRRRGAELGTRNTAPTT